MCLQISKVIYCSQCLLQAVRMFFSSEQLPVLLSIHHIP